MIRLAVSEDWDSISDISRRSGYIDYINRIGPAFLEDGEVFVYENPDIQAFTKLRYLADNAAWFSGLRVDPEYWRKGIGSKLAMATVERARDRGCSVFRALVFEDNFRSLKLFENLGALRIGTYHFLNAIPELSAFEVHSAKISGYVDSGWEFTRYPENDPLEVEMYVKGGWEIIRPDERTLQILKRGNEKLRLLNNDGFTCFEETGDSKRNPIFEEETEESTGYLLEIALNDL